MITNTSIGLLLLLLLPPRFWLDPYCPQNERQYPTMLHWHSQTTVEDTWPTHCTGEDILRDDVSRTILPNDTEKDNMPQ